MRKQCGFVHFRVLSLESAETSLFVQINVFAVRALRLDRKYTTVVGVPRVRLSISGTKSGANPETPRKRSQSKF